MRRLFASIAMTAAVLAPAVASAQQGTTQTPLASPSTSSLVLHSAPGQSAAFAPVAPIAPIAPVASVAPSAMIHADVAGIHTTNKADAPFEVAAAPNGLNQGQGVALMAVGGAGLLAGLLIGGDAGAAVAIGGLAAGLVGLYQYVR